MLLGQAIQEDNYQFDKTRNALINITEENLQMSQGAGGHDKLSVDDMKLIGAVRQGVNDVMNPAYAYHLPDEFQYMVNGLANSYEYNGDDLIRQYIIRLKDEVEAIMYKYNSRAGSLNDMTLDNRILTQ